MVDVAVWVLCHGVSRRISIEDGHFTYEIGMLVTETTALAASD